MTRDVTKGDWLQKENRNPYNHYIENTFFATKNILYIIDAEKSLETISFENIHKEIEELNIEELLDRESSIVTIDKKRGFGFIYSKKENLYFNISDFTGSDFDELEKDDIVKYAEGTNLSGEIIAKNVKKSRYSFVSDPSKIQCSKISWIDYERGIGFILYQPENLYFHQSSLDAELDFKDFKIGDAVEFLTGKNADGEAIARLVRMKL